MSRLTPLALTVARAKRQALATARPGTLIPAGAVHADRGAVRPDDRFERAGRQASSTSAALATEALVDLDRDLRAPDEPPDVVHAGADPPAGAARPLDADRAMAALAPFVRETAQRIHGRYYALRKQCAADFVSQAPALVWARIDHFEQWYYSELPPEARAQAEKDYFAAWCYRELNFRYLDFGRAQKAEPRAKPLDSTGDVADTRAPADEPSVYDCSLSAAEQDLLRRWDPLDGLILFCLAGQWQQVPADIWEQWTRDVGVAPPFPPSTFVDAPKTRKRAQLAEALGVSRDVIFQRWHRLKKKYLH